MQGRVFLDLAREIARGTSEGHRRVASGRAYYALMLECRDALFLWGFTLPPRETVHAFVYQRFATPNHHDLQVIGDSLNSLVRLRNEADYQLKNQGSFRNAGPVQQAIRQAADALFILDRLDNDRISRASAVAAIRAAFP